MKVGLRSRKHARKRRPCAAPDTWPSPNAGGGGGTDAQAHVRAAALTHARSDTLVLGRSLQISQARKRTQ
eukprot:1630024-Pleurochrysis_carterae.AAC.7